MPAHRPPPAASRIFQPTWGRGLFALALAIVGFLFPQEIPLEWYPLNNPGEDINYLEITCASDKNGEVHIFYDTGKGSNELDSIRWPISPTTQTYTYTFPLPDAPLTDLSLAPVANGGALTIRQMRIIDRRGTEMRRFTREMFTPIGNIAAIIPLPDGWKIVSEPNFSTPGVHIKMDAPILAKGIGHRNFLRCLYSSGYLTLMLWILLLAVLFTFYRPRSWRDAGVHLGFMAALALMFSLVGNRGLIKNSIRYAGFKPAIVTPGAQLEVDLRIDHPSTAQLFWDSGHGFNEADSIRQNYEPHQGLQTLRFPLPSKKLKGLRIDPLDGEAQLVIRNVRIVDAGRRTLAVLPLNTLEASRDIDRYLITEEGLTVHTTPGHNDPILIFKPDALTIVNQVAGMLPITTISFDSPSESSSSVLWTMLDVTGPTGQADCHLIQFADGTNVLIDAADAIDAPGSALAYLRARGVHQISLVILSHFHKDHYGRLLDILNAGITVDRVVLNVPNKQSADREIPSGCDWNDVQVVLGELRARNIPFTTPKAGDHLLRIENRDGTSAGIDVLACYDGLNTPVGRTDVNDTSIIVRMFTGSTRVLFTGDLNHALGSYLAKSDIDLKADLLKAPHHGTDGTAPNEFYDRVAAHALLVPSPKALWESARSMRTRNYFIERHVPIYVSGINGNVTVTMTKDGYSIRAER